MGYKNNLIFAIRSLLIYEHFKKDAVSKKYKYTMAAGVLLNVLSATLESNGHFKFNFETLKNIDLPKYTEKKKDKKNIGQYLKRIWGALAKKTDGNKGNFTCDKEKGDIVSFSLKTENYTKKITLTDSDLIKLLKILEKNIREQYPEDYKREEGDVK